MPKDGIAFDYDLHANLAPGAKRDSVCVACDDSPVCYRWSDYHGEGMCCTCGMPYQLQAGSPEQVAEGKYPYVNVKPEWVPVIRRHWQETKRFVYLGTAFGPKPGLAEFFEWVEANTAAPVVSPAPSREGEEKG